MLMPNEREILRQILMEYGYSEWHIIEPVSLSRSSQTSFVLFNPTEKRKTEIAIPNDWLDDPRRHHTIVELIKLAIDNSSPTVSRSGARKFFLIVGQTNHSASKRS